MKFNAGLMRSASTGRYHPVWYYPTTLPQTGEPALVLHRSGGHHTVGFDTAHEARAWVEEQPHLVFNETLVTWNSVYGPDHELRLPRIT